MIQVGESVTLAKKWRPKSYANIIDVPPVGTNGIITGETSEYNPHHDDFDFYVFVKFEGFDGEWTCDTSELKQKPAY